MRAARGLISVLWIVCMLIWTQAVVCYPLRILGILVKVIMRLLLILFDNVVYIPDCTWLGHVIVDQGHSAPWTDAEWPEV